MHGCHHGLRPPAAAVDRVLHPHPHRGVQSRITNDIGAWNRSSPRPRTSIAANFTTADCHRGRNDRLVLRCPHLASCRRPIYLTPRSPACAGPSHRAAAASWPTHNVTIEEDCRQRRPAGQDDGHGPSWCSGSLLLGPPDRPGAALQLGRDAGGWPSLSIISLRSPRSSTSRPAAGHGRRDDIGP